MVLLIFFLSLPWALADNNWRINKSTHFVVYYKGAPEGFIAEVAEKAEDYYDSIASSLGFRRFDFWLWDNRAKIYIHDNAAGYQAATGQPGWSGGCAKVREKIIHSFPYAKGFLETVLPHEMGHIIFREFVGFDNYAIPLWLDEGVASYQQKLKYSAGIKAEVRNAIGKGSFIPLERLSRFNPQFAMSNESVQLFYAEASSVIEFLIKEFGRDSFILFCQALRDKKDLDRAIASGYPLGNIRELNQAWQKYLRNDPR